MPKGKGKHLTLADRVRIEQGINNKESFSAIARAIGVAPSTITREVKTNRHAYMPKGAKRVNLCAHKGGCVVKGLCEDNCLQKLCRNCKNQRCTELCLEFEERICPDIERAPYVCNSCKKMLVCGSKRYTYRAIYANESYEQRLVSTRQGISITPEELSSMTRLVKRLLGQGQSLEAIWATHGDRFPVGIRTFYNYTESGLYGIANIDLPRKVRYKPRKKIIRQHPERIDRLGRTYTDFLSLDEDVCRSAVQMDCVMGKRGDFKCILTLHFPRFEFQIYLLLSDHNRECVIGALDWIEVLCEGSYSKHFGVILTDRGHEFSDFESVERSCLRPQRRGKVYYCDPMRSGQRGSGEKNHVELRRILPKGTSLEGLNNYGLATIASHINSYPRPSLGGIAPVVLASQALPKSLLDGLGITHIPPDDVIINPSLVKKP
jgi:IS30 family transposase